MTTTKISINLTGIEYLGGVKAVLDFAQAADRAGVDQLTLAEHVAMGTDFSGYPYGRYPSTADAIWFEPITLLSAIAAVTSRARLSTSILIAPLRPAVLLAKQLATLDHLSGGRLEIGVGTGWQRAEYEASGVPFEGRMARLEEHVSAMRALWTHAPAQYHGEHIRFEGLHSIPHPVQPGGVPIWFGVAPSAANVEIIASHGAGWAPWFGLPSGDARKDIPRTAALERISSGRARLHDALRARGRDPATFAIRTMPEPVMAATGFDLAPTIAQCKDYIDAGVTHLEFAPGLFCSSAGELEQALEMILTLRK